MSVDPGFQRDRVLVAQVFAWDHNPTPASAAHVLRHDDRAARGASGGAAGRRGLGDAVHRVEHQHPERVHDRRPAAGDGRRSAARVSHRGHARLLRRHAHSAQGRAPARGPRRRRQQARRGHQRGAGAPVLAGQRRSDRRHAAVPILGHADRASRSSASSARCGTIRLDRARATSCSCRSRRCRSAR